MLRKILVRSGLAPFLLTAVAAVNVGADVIQSDFSSTPPGSRFIGTAVVEDGVLKLTKAGVGGAFGALAFGPAPTSTTVNAMAVSWKSLVGGGQNGGADGYSLNIGADLADSFTAEEGTGTGLTVTVDTFDNGTGLDVGVDVKWGGTRVAYAPIPKDNPGNGIFLRKNTFVDASLTLSPSGSVTLNYDGNIISATIPAYTGLVANQVMLAGRTGGANDNQWIDDLKIVFQGADVALLGVDSSDWKYQVNGADPNYSPFDAWTAPGFDDSAWLTGRGLFGVEPTIANYAPWIINTPLPNPGGGGHSYYLRSHINWAGGTDGVTLTFTNYMDDGILVWLNGVEIFDFNVPTDRPLSYNAGYTLPRAANPLGEGVPFITNVVPSNLVVGDNVISVAVYQHGAGTSDATFGMSAKARPPVPATIVDMLQPSGGVVFANRTRTLNAVAIGSPTPSYQWYLNGAPIDPAVNPTANSASYVITTMQPGDAGDYFCRVSNVLGTADTRTATLTYENDVTAPSVASASGDHTMNKVFVRFDELVDPLSSVDLFSYSITPAVGINGASLRADGRTVMLTLDTLLTPDTDYTVTVTGVADLAGNPISGSSSATFHTFVLSPGFLNFAVFDTIPGTPVANLTGSPKYPNSPDATFLLPAFDTRPALPNDLRNEYGGLIEGFFVPPTSGNWILYIRSDDASQLWFDRNDGAGLTMVQEETGCCKAFSALPTAALALTGGQAYAVRAIYKEGGGGDFCQVTAKLESDPVNPDTLPPLSGASIATYAPPGEGTVAITTQPVSTTVVENSPATFTVAGAGSFRGNTTVVYSWERSDDGGATWVGVRNSYTTAGSASFTLSIPKIADDDGDKYRVRLFVPGASVTSDVVTLNVTPDITPPTVVGASGSGSMRNITVNFSELLAGGSVTDLFNYGVSGGLSLTAAALGADGKSAVLTVDPAMTENTTYTVTLNNITDLVGNAVATDTTVSFQSFIFSAGFVTFETYEGIGGTPVVNLTGDPRYPNSPTRRFFIAGLDTRQALPTDSLENYGGRITGFFVPPASGNYIFYLRSDDASQLLFDRNDGAGLTMVQEETGCCRAFSALPTAPLALIAGERYPIMGLYKEGGGGDYMQVAAKLESDATPPDALRPIGAAQLGSFANGAGVSINITQNPTDQLFISAPNTVAIDDFNAGDAGYTVETPIAYDGAWRYNAGRGSWQNEGQGPENNQENTSILTSRTYNISKAGNVTLRFAHRFSFENEWDGGVVQVSINGGAFATVPAASFSQNGYATTLRGNSRSRLAGQIVFGSDSANYAIGYITSVCNIGAANPGDTVQFRFVASHDSNTLGNQAPPAWELDRIQVDQGAAGAQSVSFTVAATAVVPGLANPPVFYQWYRNNGAGWVLIPGANNATYTLVPVLADNGAKFRCTVYTPGAQTTSGEATLTVVQPNTAPQFACGPNQAVAEDAGAQSVAGWASDIQVHSIVRVPTVYANDFSAGAAGMELRSVATVADGVLKLTTQITSQYGAASISTPSATLYESLDVSWKSLVGGGVNGGADGYSLNIGTDVPVDPGYGGEEGIGTGIIVTVDTFDNGTGTDVGVDIKWGGARVAYASIPKDDDGSGNYLRKNTFVDAHLTLSGAGVATMTYDGNTISATIPGYAGIQANRALFWARTGGASDNQWVDDFSFAGFPYDASSAELGQTVQFNVTTDNAALFSAGPSISADGTLTYTPAANASGSATVTVTAQDNGGTAYGGRDTSAACTFTITVRGVCDAIAAVDDSGTTVGPAPVTIDVLANDSDIEGGLTLTGVTQGANGSVVIVDGKAVYTANSGFEGTDTFTYSVVNACGSQARATVTITVLPDNRPPTAKIDTDALVDFSPDFEHPVLISCNWWNACLILDGSLSSDPDGDALTYWWFVQPSTLPFAGGPVATNCLEVGTHTIVLTVTDTKGASHSDTLTIEEITAPLAIELLMEKVTESSLSRTIKRELLTVLRTALNQAKAERIRPTQITLDNFEKKVRAKVVGSHSDLAASLIRWSQAISSGMEKCIKAPVVKKDYEDGKTR